MAIIVSRNGKGAQKVERTSIEREDYLQQYIYENPGSIPLYEVKDDVRLLIVAREYPTDSGPIDALGIDGDGDIYVIETKLYRNPDKRLVVAQVLDYGAALWSTYANPADFFSLVDREIGKSFGIGADQKLMEVYGIGEEELETLKATIGANLSRGKYKFVVLMDHLHARLRDLIIYLNQNSQFDIYAVEMEYYNYEQLEIVIPKLFGAEVRKDKGVSPSGGSKRKWDKASFFEEAARVLSPEHFTAVERLYTFFEDISDTITWGTGSRRGSFNPKVQTIGSWAPYNVYSDGHLQVNFYSFRDSDALLAVRDAIHKGLNRIEGVYIPAKSIDTFYNLTLTVTD